MAPRLRRADQAIVMMAMASKAKTVFVRFSFSTMAA